MGMEIPMTRRSRLPRAAGFTLIELMVTIVIGSILMMVAVPIYTSEVRKSRRTEARTAILDLATREERYFSVNNSYTNVGSALGYGAGVGAMTGAGAQTVGSGYYTLTVTPSAGSLPGVTPVVQPGYQAIATAVGTQTKDTACATFTIDQTGLQTSAPAAAATCWN
jgi:type IV pilus assembly protein PilE